MGWGARASMSGEGRDGIENVACNDDESASSMFVVMTGKNKTTLTHGATAAVQ